MFDRTQSMLPKTATDLARALDILEERLFALPVAMISKDPMTVSEALLDHLAFEESVDVWDVDWPVDVKRNIIAVSAELHRFKGTPYAIHKALSAFGVDLELLEWWEPDGLQAGMEAGSFRVTAFFGNEIYQGEIADVDIRMFNAMNAVLQRVAPVSRKFTLQLGHRFEAIAGVRAMATPILKSSDIYSFGARPVMSEFSTGLRSTVKIGLRSLTQHLVRRRGDVLDMLFSRFGIGQSTMGPSGQDDGAAVIGGARYPLHCFQPNIPRAYGTERTVGDGRATIKGVDIVSVEAAQDIDFYGENFHITLTGWAFEFIWRHLEGQPTLGQVGVTVWEGGANIDMFRPGTSNFENTEVFLSRWDALGDAHGRQMGAPVLHWTQGEGFYVGYESALEEVFDALDDAWNKVGYPAPIKFALQVNLSDNAIDDLESRSAIVKMARQGRCMLVGPMYIAPLADNIHPNQYGDVILANMAALAEYRMRKGFDTAPLWFVGGELGIDRVTVSFHLPHFCDQIEISDNLTPAVKDAGFACVDRLGALEISQLIVSGPAEITFVFARKIFGPVTVEYAGITMDSGVEGWANGMGNVVSMSSVPMLFAGDVYSGRTVPDFIPQPAMADKITIGES